MLRIDGVGEVLGEVASGLRAPRALAAGEDGVLWVSQEGGVVGLRDGRPVAELREVSAPHGIAVRGDTVLVADPSGRRLVAFEVSRGIHRDVVTDAPLGPPVDEARVPLATTPLLADGEGFLVGCDGEGSLRRLVPA